MTEASTLEAPGGGEAIERGLLIGGESVPASSGKLADDVSPWDGEVYARVAAGKPKDVAWATDVAQAAFASWSELGAYERREIFLTAAEVMAKRGEEAITALASETGASRLFSEVNVAVCIQVLREAAAAITRPMGELLPTSIPGAYSIAQRVPFGVVGAISPWNAPLVLGMRSIAIPLAVGNTVVMKPSEDAPITCGLFLADVLAEAGLPPGVLNVVTNDLADAGDVVSALIADPRVRIVNFTGSTNVGRIIGVQAAQNLKPAVLELGGKNPLIILEAADPDLAVDAAAFGAFMNSGLKAPSSPPVLLELVLPGASSATRPVVARLVKCAESIPHESVCLGVHLPRHPADADALELSAETARDFVQLSEMRLLHRGDTVYLVHHELRVHEDPDSLDPVIARKLQSLDQRSVLRNVVGGGTNRPRDLSHDNQTARSQERTNRRAAQWVPGVAPISVEKVVPALQAGQLCGLGLRRLRLGLRRLAEQDAAKSERVSRGRRGSDVQTPSAIVGVASR